MADSALLARQLPPCLGVQPYAIRLDQKLASSGGCAGQYLQIQFWCLRVAMLDTDGLLSRCTIVHWLCGQALKALPAALFPALRCGEVTSCQQQW